MNQVARARRGFNEAQQRLVQSYNAPGGDLDGAYIAIAEAVMWTCAIHEVREGNPSYDLLLARDEDGPCVVGVTLARNAALHKLVEVASMGQARSYPRAYPRRYQSWRWLPAGDLSRHLRHQAENELAYESHLAGREVETTLSRIRRFMEADAGQSRTK